MIIISSRNFCSFNLKSRIQHPAKRWISSSPSTTSKWAFIMNVVISVSRKKAHNSHNSGSAAYCLLCDKYYFRTSRAECEGVKFDMGRLFLKLNTKRLVKIYKSYTNKLTPSLLKARIIYGHLAQRFRKTKKPGSLYQKLITKNSQFLHYLLKENECIVILGGRSVPVKLCSNHTETNGPKALCPECKN